jgi:hypothetical protein
MPQHTSPVGSSRGRRPASILHASQEAPVMTNALPGSVLVTALRLLLHRRTKHARRTLTTTTAAPSATPSCSCTTVAAIATTTATSTHTWARVRGTPALLTEHNANCAMGFKPYPAPRGGPLQLRGGGGAACGAASSTIHSLLAAVAGAVAARRQCAREQHANRAPRYELAGALAACRARVAHTAGTVPCGASLAHAMPGAGL